MLNITRTCLKANNICLHRSAAPIILYSAKANPNLIIAGWIEDSLPFFRSCAVIEDVGAVVEMAIWGKWAKRETFLSVLEEEALAKLAVFWGRGGRGAPTGGALETEGRRLLTAAPAFSTASPLGDVIPLSLPLKLVGLDPRRVDEEAAFLPAFEGFAAVEVVWTEVAESIGNFTGD